MIMELFSVDFVSFALFRRYDLVPDSESVIVLLMTLWPGKSLLIPTTLHGPYYIMIIIIINYDVHNNKLQN